MADLTVGDVMAEARAKAVAESRALRGEAPPPPPSRPAAMSVTFTCPTCSGPLVGGHVTRLGPTRGESVWVCDPCHVSWRATVSLANLGRRWPLRPILDDLRLARAYELADLWGYSRSVVLRWDADGLSDERADAFACRLGMHPSSLWPTWFDAMADDEGGGV